MILLNTLEKNKNLRKIFGERELVIIKKQLFGIRLKPSEKTRLSRDIKKKFEAIKSLVPYTEEFSLKKATLIKNYVKMAIEKIKKDCLFSRINQIILFGSTIENTRTFRSDIDIAIKFDQIDKDEAFDFRVRISKSLPDDIDIQVYNLLPDKIRESIKKNYKLLYKKNGRKKNK